MTDDEVQITTLERTDLTPDAAPEGYEEVHRVIKIRPCVLSRSDLRKIAVELSKLATEAVDKQLSTWIKPPEQDPTKWGTSLNEIRQKCWLTIIVLGADGEQAIGNSISMLDDHAMPARIVSVTFDSASTIRLVHSVDLPNRFRVNVDLTGPPPFTSYDPWSAPTPNMSTIDIQGPDTTWVNGAVYAVAKLFSVKQTNREWLHKRSTYNVYNWVVAFPLSLWLTALLDDWLNPRLHPPEAVRIMVDLYMSLLLLLVFRSIIEKVRWLFPIIELEGSRNHAWRTVLTAIFTSLIVSQVGRLLWGLFTGHL